MIKFEQGSIGGKDGVWKNIVVKAAAPNNLKDAFIGGGMIMIGIVYLTYKAFRNGSEAFEKAEYMTLEELGYIDDYRDCIGRE